LTRGGCLQRGACDRKSRVRLTGCRAFFYRGFGATADVSDGGCCSHPQPLLLCKCVRGAAVCAACVGSPWHSSRASLVLDQCSWGCAEEEGEGPRLLLLWVWEAHGTDVEPPWHISRMSLFALPALGRGVRRVVLACACRGRGGRGAAVISRVRGVWFWWWRRQPWHIFRASSVLGECLAEVCADLCWAGAVLPGWARRARGKGAGC
jgi:hypothetical protein